MDATTPAKYRKMPVVIEAFRSNERVEIVTLEGTMVAEPGDYIITGVKGEQYPCKPDIFAITYERCEDAEVNRGEAMSVNEYNRGLQYGVRINTIGETVYLRHKLGSKEQELRTLKAERDAMAQMIEAAMMIFHMWHCDPTISDKETLMSMAATLEENANADVHTHDSVKLFIEREQNAHANSRKIG